MSISAIYGHLTAFDPTTEVWTDYIECLKFYFTTSGITNASK